ncbi:MAG: hypothetical protein Q8880_10710 [Bacteroidota bacterium]|nr:hypothetical protein [Bacteroidota bacterium]
MKNIVYIVFLVCLFIIISCKKEEQAAGWDVNVLCPVIKTSLSINNIVPDSLLKKNPDNTLTLTYQNKVYSSGYDNIYNLGDTSFITSLKLDSITLGNHSIVKSTSLGNILNTSGYSFISALNGGYIIIPAIGPLKPNSFEIDINDYFKNATFISGWLDIQIENGLPIDIQNVTFQLKNHTKGDVVASQTFAGIPAHSKVIQTSSLDGKTVEGKLDVTISGISSPGSSGLVLLDTSNAIKTTVTVRSLNPLIATAVFPAQNLINKSKDITLNVTQALFNEITILKGTVEIEAYNTIQDTIKFWYDIPGAKKSGIPFTAYSVLPPAPKGGVSSIRKSYDFKGYDLNMNGSDGKSYNTFLNSARARIDSTGKIVTISRNDSIYLKISLKGIVPEYAKGYLGSKNYPQTGTTALTLFSKITSGKIDFKDLSVSLSCINYVGADATIKINKLTASNTNSKSSIDLTGDFLNNTYNIIRAKDNGFNNITPTLTEIKLNNNNSNLRQFFENMPGNISYNIDMMLNPKGNASGGNDFIYYNKGVDVNLNIEVPLNLIANNLTLEDTIDFDMEKMTSGKSVRKGMFTLIADNGFPFEARVQIYMIGNNNQFLDSVITNTNIYKAQTDKNGMVTKQNRSKLYLPFDENKTTKLYSTKKFIIKTIFNTFDDQYVKIYSNYRIDFKLTADFEYRYIK